MTWVVQFYLQCLLWYSLQFCFCYYRDKKLLHPNLAKASETNLTKRTAKEKMPYKPIMTSSKEVTPFRRNVTSHVTIVTGVFGPNPGTNIANPTNNDNKNKSKRNRNRNRKSKNKSFKGSKKQKQKSETENSSSFSQINEDPVHHVISHRRRSNNQDRSSSFQRALPSNKERSVR